MNEKNTLKNGGFPPLKYCSEQDKTKKDEPKGKERFFANAPVLNINVRQLLSDTKKKPLIVIEEPNKDDIEVADTL